MDRVTSKLKSKRAAKPDQAGFTIVEFLIATTVFSMVILLCSYAIIHIGRMYYKGMITNRTQDVSREVMDDVVAAIQFGPSSSDYSDYVQTAGPTTYNGNGVEVRSYCIGGTRYTYANGAVLGDTSGVSGGITYSRHVLWRDRFVGACQTIDITQADPGGINGREMLSSGMRLPEFAITTPAPGEPWGVSMTVSYGDSSDLFEPASNFSICRGTSSGGQFCAVSGFNTSVTKRL